jgi:hypothetical protein
MKTTLSQIEKAVKNTFEFGTDGTQDRYDAIKSCEDSAVLKVGIDVQKTQKYFTKSDWRKVYSEIKNKLLSKTKAKT